MKEEFVFSGTVCRLDGKLQNLGPTIYDGRVRDECCMCVSIVRGDVV
jgi:hypothetical protein